MMSSTEVQVESIKELARKKNANRMMDVIRPLLLFKSALATPVFGVQNRDSNTYQLPTANVIVKSTCEIT